MSGSIVRDYNFSVRLSQQESAELEQLAAQLDTDKSNAVRQAVRSYVRSGIIHGD